MKKAKSNPYRKKVTQKKPKIHKDHPVIQYLSEVKIQEANLKTASQKSILGVETNKLLYSLETNKAQVLGYDVTEFKTRVQLFLDLKTSLSDAISLSLAIPSIFHINDTNLRSIARILRRYNISVEKLVYKYPYVCAMNRNHVEDNLKILSEIFPKDELDNFIFNNPQMIVFKLDRTSVEKLTQHSLASDENTSKLNNIKVTLNSPAVNNVQLDTLVPAGKTFDQLIDEEMIELLTSYDIDLQYMYKLCPEFMVTPINTIEECLEYITGSPFYFEVDDVQQLLKTYPDIVLMFDNEETLKMVSYLETVFTQKGHLYRILNEDPEMLRDSDTFFRRIEIFKRFKFKKSDIALILAQPGGTSFFTDCLEFTDDRIKESLEFFFSKTDIVPSQIVFSVQACLSPKFTKIARERVSYMRKIQKMHILVKKRKRKRSQITLKSVIKCELEHFITSICGTTQSDYDVFLRDYTQKK